MVHDYLDRREAFLAHYHKRGNVESVFSMIKRMFGDNVRRRPDTAKVNEALAEIVCHNHCCVIRSQCGVGIEAAFWAEEPAERDATAILPFPGSPPPAKGGRGHPRVHAVQWLDGKDPDGGRQ